MANRHQGERLTPAGLREALRLLKPKVEKRMPTERDVPPPSVFPGRKAKALPGQFDLYGNEAE